MEKNDLFVCRECGDELFTSLNALNNHVRTRHSKSRSLTNLELVESYIFNDIKDSCTSYWSEGLEFLRSIPSDPPPFRQTLISKIKFRLEEDICNTFGSLIELADEALNPCPNSRLSRKQDFDPDEILQLVYLFEQLVLFPTKLDTTKSKNAPSLNSIIRSRLLKFKQGRIKELFDESRLIVSKTPREQADNPVSILNSAQIAADVDNYKSANARITKHAPVALINDSNLHTLQALHPPSLQRGCIKPKISTRSGGTRRKFQLTPKQVLITLCHLQRGKATGIYSDSLDIYIKTAKRIRLSTDKGKKRATAFASFFEKIINGEVPNKFKAFLRKTYVVALEKDPNDKTKLRPLGVPSAIRRIAANIVLHQYRSIFAEHILPFNFAIGIGGGCDVIVKTLQLAVDKYIIEPENNGDLPTRALVSLDIKNMFNAISREKLREVIAHKFPTLEPFADLIYDGKGEQYVKLEDGTWNIIEVHEGFSQGCPASPVFAAIVLNIILREIQKGLDSRAISRKSDFGNHGDDGLGTLGLILAYVDDVNALLHHLDVKFFLDKFNELATPLGGILNTEKTRILTSTSGTSVVDALISSQDMNKMMIGTSLQQAISTYSIKIKDGIKTPVEVTDGLRVLGSPIGSVSFCQNFLSQMMNKAQEDARKIAIHLQDIQTIMRLYSMCTVHKMTHLFSSDVFNSNIADLPQSFFLWNGSLSTKFNEMTETLLCNITNLPSLPEYSHIIANMSINEGGLGLQHPRINAITSFMISTKRSLQYSKSGVWLGNNSPSPKLPPQITTLYNDWEINDCRMWTIFRKYLNIYTEICYKNADSPNDFIFKASLNGSREKAKDYASRQIKRRVLLHESLTPNHVRLILPGLLDKRASLALMTLPRLEETNRIDNDTFQICIKRKLRLKIINDVKNYVCKCGHTLDEFGDHCLGCTANSKKIASNNIRDGFIKVLQRILPVANMIKSPTQIEKEPYGIIPALPRLQPFDLSIRLDHSLDSNSWRVPFSRIGFDVVLIHSTNPSSSTHSEAAKYTETDLRLRHGEKMKFARARGSTNPFTKQSFSADQIIGEIVNNNNSFVPIAIGPHGEIGSLFRRFLQGDNALELPSFNQDRPNAKIAAERAISSRMPYNILDKANKNWMTSNNNTFFAGSYLSSTPELWANQQIGLTIQTSLATHIKCSLNKLKYKSKSAPFNQFDNENNRTSSNENDWNFYDGDYNEEDEPDDVLVRIEGAEGLPLCSPPQ